MSSTIKDPKPLASLLEEKVSPNVIECIKNIEAYSRKIFYKSNLC